MSSNDAHFKCKIILMVMVELSIESPTPPNLLGSRTARVPFRGDNSVFNKSNNNNNNNNSETRDKEGFIVPP